MVWKKCPSSQSKFWKVCQEAWSEMDADYLNKLTARMPMVYKAVVMPNILNGRVWFVYWQMIHCTFIYHRSELYLNLVMVEVTKLIKSCTCKHTTQTIMIKMAVKNEISTYASSACCVYNIIIILRHFPKRAYGYLLLKHTLWAYGLLGWYFFGIKSSSMRSHSWIPLRDVTPM